MTRGAASPTPVTAELLEATARITRRFGEDPEYSRAGSGNSSVKVGGTLYIKPSGVSLASITATTLMPLAISPLLELAANGSEEAAVPGRGPGDARRDGGAPAGRGRPAALGRVRVPCPDPEAIRRPYASDHGQRAHLRDRRGSYRPRPVRGRGPMGALHRSRAAAGQGDRPPVAIRAGGGSRRHDGGDAPPESRADRGRGRPERRSSSARSGSSA